MNSALHAIGGPRRHATVEVQLYSNLVMSSGMPFRN